MDAGSLQQHAGAGGTTAAAKLVKVERSADAMGTTYTIDAYGENQGKILAAMEQAFDEVRRLDQMISNYIPDSELSRVNDQAADHPVQVSREFFSLISSCIDYSRRSEGSFDITVGPLMKVWGFYKGSGHLPHRAEIRAALDQVGYQNIELDPSNLTLKLTRHGVNLDPGGVGKGLGVDRMVEILRTTESRPRSFPAVAAASTESVHRLQITEVGTCAFAIRKTRTRPLLRCI